MPDGVLYNMQTNQSLLTLPISGKIQ